MALISIRGKSAVSLPSLDALDSKLSKSTFMGLQIRIEISENCILLMVGLYLECCGGTDDWKVSEFQFI